MPYGKESSYQGRDSIAGKPHTVAMPGRGKVGAFKREWATTNEKPPRMKRRGG